MPRLTILTEKEQREYEYPPTLTVEAQAVCFSIDDVLETVIKRLRGATNRVGFLLQYAYFKACRRFFVAKRYRQEDIEYAAKVLGVPLNKVQLHKYKERTPQSHQQKILELFQCKAYATQQQWIEQEIKLRVSRVLEPRSLFLEILHLLHQNYVEIPSYNLLAEKIAQHYIDHENGLLNDVAKLLGNEQKVALQSLLISPLNQFASPLNQFKTINQSLQPKAINASVRLFEQIATLANPLMPVIETLGLTPDCCEYYATWVKKAKLSQLKQLSDDRKLYLRLIAFLQHQYTIRQDNFVDIFLRSVQSSKNAAIRQLQEADKLTRSQRRAAVRHLTKSRRSYRELIDEITEVTKSAVLTDTGKVETITELLTEHAESENEKEKKKLELLEQSLDDMANNKDYFDILERLSIKLQNRVSGIIKVIVFNPDNSNKQLLAAINHFKDCDGKVTAKSPTEFLKPDEQEALISEKSAFRPSLYKILLFIHVNDAIKSGELNLKHSYRYLAIQDYLIGKEEWKEKRDELLKLARLEEFSNYESAMRKLKIMLDEKYHAVNDRILKGLNPHISFNDDKNDRVQIATPALDEKETKHISAYLNQVGYVPILKILSDIDQVTGFSQSFKHHSIKNSKATPQANVFYAGIIGLGCNIGVPRMAQISAGVNQNTMTNMVKWYFNMANLNAANERIREFINRLALPHVFAHNEDERHGSSDGRKVGVSVECLLATYSFKYFGKDKGVSIYTFIDDRHVLFHHHVMSSSEREAAYVIDGLNNMNVTKIDIHSTDSHGYTELIFSAMHLLGTTFAPRLKNIGKQKIYAFSTKKSYQKLGYKLLPSRPISQKLIENHWEDILRFMATIRLNKVSASQLFKRLSSYAKDNPLYKALKEFGRIVKSLFILTYLDDVKLRQRVEKQLNRIESSNKFAKAIFYANNGEFKQSDPVEQNITVACKIMIQNSIVLWNYLYLSELLSNCSDDKERAEMILLIKEGSVLTWTHVNLHGEFNFRRNAVNDCAFDLAKILALKVK